MQADEVFAVLLRKIKLGGGSTADIQNAVNNYLDENPVEAGATEEEAKQIEANKAAIGQLIKDFEDIETKAGSYDILKDKPSINDVTLEGNNTFENLGMKPLTNLEIMQIINKAAN